MTELSARRTSHFLGQQTLLYDKNVIVFELIVQVFPLQCLLSSCGKAFIGTTRIFIVYF